MDLLYGLAIVVLFWTPVGLLLHGYYVHSHDTLEEAEFNLDRDMKTWAPIVALVGVLLLPSYILKLLVIGGLCFEIYMTYADEETSIAKFKRFLRRD